MPSADSPFTSTILPIGVPRLAAHPNIVTAVLVGRTDPITLEHGGVRVTGDVLLVRPGIVHSVRVSERGADVIFLNGLAFPFEAPLAVVLKGRLEQLARRSLGGDPGAQSPAPQRNCGQGSHSRPLPLPPKIVEIVRAMQADPMRRVTQDELVRYLRMERTRALRCFKATTGLTFRRYKLWSALQHAAVSMAGRELVRTAAIDAGFADTSHLSRVFSSVFGLPPSVAIAALDEQDAGTARRVD